MVGLTPCASVMKYQLVLQWPAESIGDYDRMVDIETQIIDSLAEQDADVDGHDAGPGEMNIFLHTDTPELVFDRIRPVLLKENAMQEVRVAYRPIAGGDYTILWPKGLRNFAVT